MSDDCFTIEETEKKIEKLPPSSKLVLKVLEYNNKMTQKEIAEETRLSKRTIRDALNKLQEENVVKKVPCLEDARKSLYEIETVKTQKKIEA